MHCSISNAWRGRPSNLPPYPQNLPPVMPPQQHPLPPPPEASSSAVPPPAIAELQFQLQDTQMSLLNHVDKFHVLETVLSEHKHQARNGVSLPAHRRAQGPLLRDAGWHDGESPFPLGMHYCLIPNAWRGQPLNLPPYLQNLPPVMPHPPPPPPEASSSAVPPPAIADLPSQLQETQMSLSNYVDTTSTSSAFLRQCFPSTNT